MWRCAVIDMSVHVIGLLRRIRLRGSRAKTGPDGWARAPSRLADGQPSGMAPTRGNRHLAEIHVDRSTSSPNACCRRVTIGRKTSLSSGREVPMAGEWARWTG